MKTVLVTGATGLLGSTLVPLLQLSGHDVKTHARVCNADYQADLSNPKDAFKLLSQIEPEVIINLVGLTDVDLCEAKPNSAYMVNVRTTENIVGWMKKTKTHCQLIQISTDQVYDGNGPNSEEEAVLTNYYAFSKYAAELAALTTSSTIFRTNFFGRSLCKKRSSLTDWLFNSLSKGDKIQVFDDVLFSPITMNTFSEMIELVLRKHLIGVFNLGSHNGMSKANFAFSFAEELGLPTGNITRTTTDKVSFLKTYRPKDMRMECSKFENMGIRLPILHDEIKRVAREYDEVT